jgi:TonB family protein
VWFGRNPGVGLDAGHCRVAAGIQLGAMNYFSDTQETASCFGDFIDDLHDVFRCHDVDFGSAEDFFAFARTLKYHSDLRGDVLRVVKAVMESETDVSFRTILTVIAIASGGPEIATSEREMSIPVKLVIESLIGVGVCSQLTAEHPGLYSDLTVKEMGPPDAAEASLSSGGGEAMACTEENASVPVVGLEESSAGGAETAGDGDVPGQAGMDGAVLESTAEATVSDSSDDESLPSLPSSQGLPNGYSGPSNGHQGGWNDFGGSNTLAESLTRLELNSLQLKIYLDSIDQRISRMEPRLENVAPLVLSTLPGAHTREDSGARFSAAIPSEKESQPQRNDAVSNQLGRAATAGSGASEPLAAPARPGTDSDPFNSGPFHFGRRQFALSIFVGVAMLLLAVFLFWRFGQDPGHVVIQPANVAGADVATRGAASVSNAPVASASGPQVAGVSEPSVAPVSAAQGKSSASGYGGQEVGPPVDKATPLSRKSAQTPLRSPLRSSSPAAAPTMAKDVAVTDHSDDAEDLSSVPLSNRLVNVSSGVMAANLLSAPKPSYPTLASLTRTQGNVVMEAVISKDGTVGELHVIKGHRLLRGAAKNAVRSWRYRPYKIDGVPVDVATTVSVDFSLHR